MASRRIAIAGFQHETNSFSPIKTGCSEFEIADSWPKMLRGDEIFSFSRGLNLPIAGFVQEAAKNDSVELLPVLWCAAEPAGHVTSDAFDRITSEVLEGIVSAEPLSGIYLDLHGAMVTEDHFDGEAEFLRRIRASVGWDYPIAISLDLHANISPELVQLCDHISIYQTYPHLDMAGTGGRSFHHLLELMDGYRPKKSFLQIPFLLPLHAQYTGTDPCRSLYQMAEDYSKQPSCSVEIALGFTASDTPFTGPSVIAFAPDQSSA
ncbi:MAG: M81 family metallopeptidase, partial [Salaquimonas sp.]